MRSVNRTGLVVTLAGVLLWTLAGVGQVAELTSWALPAPNALPFGIATAPDGKVYFTEFNLNRIGQLDPTTNEIRERAVGGGPAGLVVGEGGSLYFNLSHENALELLVFTGGGGKWMLPTAGAWPEVLAAAPAGPGKVNLWLNERNAHQVARFSPAQIAVTLPFIVSPANPVSPTAATLTPTVSPVAVELHNGNPLLPPPIALLVPSASGPFTEWASMFADKPVERVAVAPDGRIWFTQGEAPISVLDPDTNTALLYGIPPGSAALGVTVAPDGRVWFTDTGRAAIGSLDPATGDVRLWPIPGGSQPFALLLDELGAVWFTDREADAVGYLRPARNEIAVYSLPPGSHPLFLALDGPTTAWFTAEGGNFVGRLSVLPVLGEPPVGPSGFSFLGYSFTQSGRRASGTISYVYDGSAGLPVWITLQVLQGGTALPGFATPPVRVDRAGRGSAQVIIEYQGDLPVISSQVRLTAVADLGGPPLADQTVQFSTTWTP
ncbi:MAG: virginiamycin B lyase family protein [Candidatus Bipolaricaulaceae bacterium]